MTDSSDPRPEATPQAGSIAAEPSHERSTSGVGPWPGGREAWPTEPHFDPELLEHGDTRNVIDRYRYWRTEAIKDDLDQQRHLFHVAIENWQHDMNIGSIVRSANAFGADTVHIVGRRRWNKRGAMVTDRYQHVEHREDVAALRFLHPFGASLVEGESFVADLRGHEELVQRGGIHPDALQDLRELRW